MDAYAKGATVKMFARQYGVAPKTTRRVFPEFRSSWARTGLPSGFRAGHGGASRAPLRKCVGTRLYDQALLSLP